PRDGRREVGAFRARRFRIRQPALCGCVADDSQSRRRRGPRPGGLCEGLCRFPPVQAGHEPQGVAVPDSDEHLHQQLSQEAAPAEGARQRGHRDWQIAQADSHSSSGGRSAELEALDHLPDTDVKDALSALPEDFRMVVYYADVEGLPYKEIAKIMETPIGTVMSRLHR